MRNFLFLFILISSTLNAQLGVNIGFAERGGTYIDIVKEGYRWRVATDGSPLTSSQVDANGWPIVDARYIIDHRPVAEWISSIDDPEVYRLDVSGTYKCFFSGRATVSSSADGTIENYIYENSSNTSSYDFVVPLDSRGFFIIEFNNTELTPSSGMNTGITNFKMLRPGYENDDDELFHQPLLDILNDVNFSAIRYMNFTITNGRDPSFPNRTTWAERKLPTDASQNELASLGKNGGACWEYVIELSNKTMTDPWINIPISADANYVTELAAMFRRDLDPSLNIYVESSNEVWNRAPGFEQTEYNRLQALDLGIDERLNHARRTAELSQLFAQVYGLEEINEKIRVILCSHQPMLKWWVEPMLQYIDNTFGSPSDLIYGIASQTYFSGGRETGESVDKILDDCHASIAGQMTDTGTNEAGRTQWLEKAQDWNLKGGYFSYEGGPDHGGGSTDNIANRIMAERDERMCDMLRFNFDTSFAQIGANLAMQYRLTSAYNRNGCWGLTDDINYPYRNFKMSCIKDFLDITTELEEIETKSRIDFSVSPNPIIQNLNVNFNISKKKHIRLVMYNSLGAEVAVIIDRYIEAGNYEERVSTINLAGGIYFCKLYYDMEPVASKRLLLIN